MIEEVMVSYRLNGKLPCGGGIRDQPWDFVYWTNFLFNEIDAYQEVLRAAQ